MQDRIERLAAAALQGMLAHPTRYQPRNYEAHLPWHKAIANEAVELAHAVNDRLTKGEH